jgi:hypothetical protein
VARIPDGCSLGIVPHEGNTARRRRTPVRWTPVQAREAALRKVGKAHRMRSVLLSDWGGGPEGRSESGLNGSIVCRLRHIFKSCTMGGNEAWGWLQRSLCSGKFVTLRVATLGQA